MKTESTLRSALIALSILSQITACSDAQGPRTGEPGAISGTADGPQATAGEPIVRTYENGLSLSLTNAEIVDEIEMENGNRVVFVANESAATAMEFGPVGNRWFINEIASRTKSLVEQFKLLAPGRPLPTALARFVDGEFIEEHAELTESTHVGVAGEPLPEASEADLESGAGERGDGLYAAGLCPVTWFLPTLCVQTNRNGKIPKQVWQETSLERNGVQIANVISGAPGKANQGQTVICGDLGKVTINVVVGDPTNINMRVEVPAQIAWWSGKWITAKQCTPAGTCFHIPSVATSVAQVPAAGGTRYHWCGYFD